MSMDVSTFTCVLLLAFCVFALAFIAGMLVACLILKPKFNNESGIIITGTNEKKTEKLDVFEDNPWESARIDRAEYEKIYPTIPEERETQK
jgi:capsular polysaccharide biosynthesis protein